MVNMSINITFNEADDRYMFDWHSISVPRIGDMVMCEKRNERGGITAAPRRVNRVVWLGAYAVNIWFEAQ